MRILTFVKKHAGFIFARRVAPSQKPVMLIGRSFPKNGNGRYSFRLEPSVATTNNKISISDLRLACNVLTYSIFNPRLPSKASIPIRSFDYDRHNTSNSTRIGG